MRVLGLHLGALDCQSATVKPHRAVAARIWLPARGEQDAAAELPSRGGADETTTPRSGLMPAVTSR